MPSSALTPTHKQSEPGIVQETRHEPATTIRPGIVLIDRTGSPGELIGRKPGLVVAVYPDPQSRSGMFQVMELRVGTCMVRCVLRHAPNWREAIV